MTAGSMVPVAAGTFTNAVEVACGGSHACARLRDGTVACWGSNAEGQLGLGLGAPAAKTAPGASLTRPW